MAEYQLSKTGTQIDQLLQAVGELQTDMDTAQENITSLQTAVGGKASVAISTTVSLPSASWAASGSLFTQAVSVSGLLATDTPFCQAVCDDATDAEAWGAIIKATPTAGTLTFTATETPSVDLDIQVAVIR